jgi:hypothetical protein
MVLADLAFDSFGYRFLYLLHILFIVVGFGSTFVYPALARRARSLTPPEGHAISHASIEVSKGMTNYSIYGAGIVGVVLVSVSEGFKFSQTWITIAFVLFFLGVAISLGLHGPNLRAMDALQEKLLAGDAKPAGGGPPPEVAELEQRGKRAAMIGGILHLIFLLLVIDMIWKPGL